MALAVMADDLAAMGLSDDDALRVSDAMDAVGRHATRWPKVREIIDALPAKPRQDVDMGFDPPWLARLKRQWWDNHPELKQQPHESDIEHGERCKAWCLKRSPELARAAAKPMPDLDPEWLAAEKARENAASAHHASDYATNDA